MVNQKRPNILWISFEDANPYYGCYGDPVARTPNLDNLAAQGCRWPNTFSTAGVCAPARSAIITGMHPVSIGTHHMRTTHTNKHTPEMPTPYSAVIPHYVKCFPEYLRQAGYYCTNNVKTDYQFDPPLTAWDELSTEAHWRHRPDPEQPFFAVFNLQATHESAMWPEKCPEVSFNPDEIPLPPYFPDTPTVREAMARMYTKIEYNDSILGRLLEQLEEDGLAEETIVFHWSDHGPLPRGKRWPYDSGTHVPMIVRWPGQIEPGTVSQQLLSTMDLGPTVLSLAGVDIPCHMQGQAFLGPDAVDARSYVYMTRDRYDETYDMVRAVRDKRFKYIRNYRPELPYTLWVPFRNHHPIMQEIWRLHLEDKLEGSETLLMQPNRPVEELYDTEQDPYEIRNLAKDPAYKAELTRFRDALDEWRTQVGDMGDLPESEMVRQWYPDGIRPTTASPVIIPINRAQPGIEPSPLGGGTYQAPVAIQLHAATQGASIAYTFDTSEHAHWHLYTSPISLSEGTHKLRAKAIRIGYLESEEVQATFTVLSSEH